MLDFDLAELYDVETKVLNQAVKRNIDRFPVDFMFRLTEVEWQELRSQSVTLYENADTLRPQIATLKEGLDKMRSQSVTACRGRRSQSQTATLKSRIALP